MTKRQRLLSLWGGVTLVVIAVVWGLRGLEVASWVAGIVATVMALTLLVPSRPDDHRSAGSGTGDPTEPDRPTGIHEKILAKVGSHKRITTVVASIIAAATLVGVGTFLMRRHTPVPSPQVSVSSGSGSVASPLRSWPAKIANTSNGTFAYAGPFSGPRDRKAVRSFFEGDLLRVVCQERHGRAITDPSTGMRSTVWNKLDIDVWVSNLYTDLPPGEADLPPLGIPICAY